MSKKTIAFTKRKNRRKLLVIYYSMFGHLHRMAEDVAKGAREVEGVEVLVRRVPETLSEEVLSKMGAIEPQKSMAHVPMAN